jgi:hypothetical protein
MFLHVLVHTAEYLRLNLKMQMSGNANLVNGTLDMQSALGSGSGGGDGITADILDPMQEDLMQQLMMIRSDQTGVDNVDTSVVHLVETWLKKKMGYGKHENLEHVCKKPRYGFYQN